MTKLAAMIESTTTEVLISTMIATQKDLSKACLNVAIQEELEVRIGEDKVDEILDANR